MRRAVLALALLATAGSVAELATERHWQTPIQMIPWYAAAVLVAAIGLLALNRLPRVAKLLLALVLVSSLLGIYEHVHANVEAGYLDGTYGDTWESLPVWRQWWLAVTKTVGPAPPLAPGMLAQAALLGLLSTWRQEETDQVAGHRESRHRAT